MLKVGITLILIFVLCSNWIARAEDLESSLIKAASAGDAERLQILLSQGGKIDVREPVDGRTLLMFAASKGRKEVVRLLLEKGVDVNSKSTSGWTALIFAARHSHPEIIRLLAKKGADPNFANSLGWTALIYAANIGDADSVA